MKTDLNRRRFFKSFKGGEKIKFFKLPYWKNLNNFDICLTCNDTPCVNACKEDIITLQNHTPAIDFQNGGCTYCDECAIACKRGVLFVEKKRAIDALFSINTTKCLAWNGVICSACKDSCFENTIEFFGLFRPLINEKCINCGFCIAPCPVDAIDVKEIL